MLPLRRVTLTWAAALLLVGCAPSVPEPSAAVPPSAPTSTSPDRDPATSVPDVAATPSSPRSAGTRAERISVVKAVREARTLLPELPTGEWQVAQLSTRGVSQQVSRLDPTEGLLDRTTLAGQWVVEFFREPARSYGGERYTYSYRAIYVTADDVELLPGTRRTVDRPLRAVPFDPIKALPQAQRAAEAALDAPYAGAAVTLRRDGSDPAGWLFRFYPEPTAVELPTIVTTGLLGQGATVEGTR